MWAGIACSLVKGGSEIEVAFSIHDSVYSTDFATAFVAYDANDPDKTATTLEQRVIQTLTNFSKDNLCKFVGVGISHTVLKDVSDSRRLSIFNPTNSCEPGSQSMHSAVVVYGHYPNRVQYQTIPGQRHQISRQAANFLG